jgi:hypothetical protein
MKNILELEEVFTKNDINKNIESSPPENEEVRIPSIWVFEAYTPSTIENFHAGTTKFGWPSHNITSSSDFQATIDKYRSSFLGSCRLNIGIIVDEKCNKKWSRCKKAPLPEGIEYVYISVHQNLPSTTIVCYQFVFTEEFSKEINDPLNKEYHSYTEPTEKGYIVHDVENQKIKAVVTERASLKSLCESWVKTHFPGFFSSGILENCFPTCELITFSKFEPKEEITSNKWGSYTSILDVVDSFDIYTCDDIPNLFLKSKTHRDVVDKYNLVIFGNYNQLRCAEEQKMYGDDEDWGLQMRLHYLDETFTCWVYQMIIVGYERSIGFLRDSYGNIGDLSSKKSVDALNHLDLKHLMLKKDGAPYVLELADYARQKSHFLHNVYDFKPFHEKRLSHKSFSENIRSSLLYSCKKLQSQFHLIENTANSCREIANILSERQLAKTNNSLQKVMAVMTLVMLVLTVVTTISSFEEIKLSLKAISEIIINIFT